MTKPVRWREWTDEMILAEVHKLKASGYGQLTIEVVEHKVLEVTPAPRLRIPAEGPDQVQTSNN